MKLFRRLTLHTNTATILRQLAGMVTAGVTLPRCFDILEKTQPNTATRAMLYKIQKMLLAGHTLHYSLQTAPAWFDSFTCRLVHLGEQTGKLDIILSTLATHHENSLTWQRSVRQALFYPCMILIAAILLTLGLMLFVIPAFAELFQQSNQPLPVLTRAIFSISYFLRATTPFFLLITGAMLVIWLRHKHIFRPQAMLLLIPQLAHTLQTYAVIQCCRHLALALAAGIPLLEALTLTTDLTHNAELNSAMRKLRASLSAGYSFANAMQPHSVFPVLLQQMAKSGEESGTLDSMLNHAAELLETELNARIFHFTKLLEPLIMCVLGVLIGGLVIGMYLPVFNLGSVI